MIKNYVAIEGINGSGKTTLINRLKICLKEYTFVKEPYGTEFSRKIYEFVLKNNFTREQEQWLFSVGRKDILKGIEGNVITDRSIYSAYHYGLREIEGEILPNKVIFMYITREEFEERRKGEDKYDKEEKYENQQRFIEEIKIVNKNVDMLIVTSDYKIKNIINFIK